MTRNTEPTLPAGYSAPSPDLGRREFLVAAAAAASGFALASYGVAEAQQPPSGHGEAPPAAPSQPPAASPAPNPWAVHLQIATDGTVSITSPQTEIGQGIYDGLARILADELDADWPSVVVVLPHANPLLANPISKRQRIGGSDSVVTYRDVLRRLGASAREMLAAAAATRWNVAPDACTTDAGRVLHAASGRSISYGEIASDAAKLPVPARPRLKTPAEQKFVGKRLTRKDTPSKVDGTAVFSVDVRAPGMVYAALRRANSFGGKLKKFDGSSVRGKPGVLGVVPLDDAVAVVADSWWRARTAAEALEVEFDESALRGLSTEGVSATLRRALNDDAKAAEFPKLDFSSMPPKREFADRVALAAALATPKARQLDVTYEVPYLAHMTMEPQSAVARVSADTVELWGGFQQPDYSRNLAAQLTGVPVERVRVNVTFGGGGFGRRWELDSTEQVVRIAKTMPGRPVNLIWTREQDLQHDFYRAAYMARYRAAIDGSGKPLAVHGRIAGQSIFGFKRLPSPFPGLPDPTSVGGLLFDEYAIPHRLAEYAEVSLPIPIGFWRAVSASQNVFFSESLMDELAHAAKRDPFEYRRELLAGRTRTLNVLELAARESGWSNRLPKGHGRGIAVSSGFGGVCVEVIEVSVKGNRCAIERVTAAYDCGPMIDPGVVEAQIQGGIVWGLSAAISGESTIAEGTMQQSNFHQQPMLAITGTPKIDVHLVKSEGRIGGVGESGVPAAAPALANAIFAATGKRVRTLPLIKAGFEFAR